MSLACVCLCVRHIEDADMNAVDKALDQLRAALAAEIEAAERRGAANAAAELMARMQAAIGVEPVKRRGRKAKG